MKKNILKSLTPQTKSLFRFKNSDSKFKSNGFAKPDTDPTIVTTIVITL